MSNKMVMNVYHGGLTMLGVLSCIYRYFFKMSDRALLEMLLLCMGSDIVFGLLKAAKKGVLNSAIMRAGLVRKAGEIITIALLGRFDILLSSEPVLNWSEPYLCTFFTIFFTIDELVSVLENLNEIGVKIPSWISKSLLTLQKAKAEGVPSWAHKLMTNQVAKHIGQNMGSEDNDYTAK